MLLAKLRPGLLQQSRGFGFRSPLLRIASPAAHNQGFVGQEVLQTHGPLTTVRFQSQPDQALAGLTAGEGPFRDGQARSPNHFPLTAGLDQPLWETSLDQFLPD